MRALVDERRDDILACVAAERAAVRVTVTADGSLGVALHGDLAGTPQEACVRSLFADVTLADVSGQAEVIHIVRAAGEAEPTAIDESAP